MSSRDLKTYLAALTLGVIMLAACEPVPGAVSTPAVFLQGAWRACLNDGAADYTSTIRFYTDSYGVSTQSFPSTDRSCGGAASGATYAPWRYSMTDEVPATVGAGGATVAARKIDIMNSFVTIYSIVYVDHAQSPPMMYFGDLAADPALDGTAPEKRPTVLATATALAGL